MDKKVAGLVKDAMGESEKIAPLKSLKVKMKFQDEKGGKKRHKALEKARKMHSVKH